MKNVSNISVDVVSKLNQLCGQSINIDPDYTDPVSHDYLQSQQSYLQSQPSYPVGDYSCDGDSSK